MVPMKWRISFTVFSCSHGILLHHMSRISRANGYIMKPLKPWAQTNCFSPPHHAMLRYTTTTMERLTHLFFRRCLEMTMHFSSYLPYMFIWETLRQWKYTKSFQTDIIYICKGRHMEWIQVYWTIKWVTLKILSRY